VFSVVGCLSGKRQQGHISCAFDSPFDLSLAARTVAAAFAGVYFAAMGQELLERFDILVVDVLFAPSAEAALRLLWGGAHPLRRL